MIDKVMGMFTGLVAGYLTGMSIGFVFFDPNLDLWALLGVVGALIGLGIGLTPFFRRRIVIAQGAILGFYLGSLLFLLLSGNTQDDIFMPMHAGGWGLVAPLAGAVLGGIIGARLPAEKVAGPLFALIFGGFLGGLLIGTIFVRPENRSFIGMSPFVLGSGLILAALVFFLQRRKSPAAA